jgi:hypothetical protein
VARADPTYQYLGWALDQSDDEARLRDEIIDWLPAEIIDVHAHASGPASYTGFSDFGWGQARASFPTWSIDHSRCIRRFLYGRSQVRQLRFAFPFKGMDHRDANCYLRRNAGSADLVALCGLPDDLAYTEDQLRARHYCALKMYPFYFEPPAENISEYFPPPVVAVANELRIPLIVHLASPLEESAGQVLDLAAECPDTTIILAHLGRQALPTIAAQTAFRQVAECERVVLDTSMCIDSDIYRMAFANFGPERILYGSDEPFNLLRYVQFQHPERGTRLVSPREYHWLEAGIFEEYAHLAQRAVCVHWAALRALREAIGDIFPGESAVVATQVMADNAKRWVPGIASTTSGPADVPVAAD